MDHGLLRDEVLNDPVGMGYAGKSAAQLLDLLNNPANSPHSVRSANGKVPICDILNYLAGCASGAYINIKDLIDNKAMPAQVRGAALAFITYAQGAAYEGNFDLDSASIQGALGAFVAVGAITQEEVTGLLALANRKMSRAQHLWGCDVTDFDLFMAKVL